MGNLIIPFPSDKKPLKTQINALRIELYDIAWKGEIEKNFFSVF